MAKKNICTLIHGRHLRSIREGGFISTSVHTYTGAIETMTHIRLSPEVKIKKEVLCTVIHGESDAVVTFHFRAQEAFCTYRQEKQGGKRRGRKEGGERLIGHASHTKKRGKARSFPHISSTDIVSVHGGCEKSTLWPPDGEKKSKLSFFGLHLMSSR